MAGTVRFEFEIGQKVRYVPAHIEESKLDYTGVYVVVAQYLRVDRYGEFVQYGLLPWSEGEVYLAPMVRVREDEVRTYKEGIK